MTRIIDWFAHNSVAANLLMLLIIVGPRQPGAARRQVCQGICGTHH